MEDYLSSIQLHLYKAQIAAQQMHGLQDWTIQHRLTPFGCQNGDDFRNQIYAAEPRLHVVRDFANATKHGAFLTNKNRVLEKVEMTGDYSREYSREYNRVRLEMHVIPGTTPDVGGHLRNGKYLELDDILKDCLDFWTTLYGTNRIQNHGSERHEAEAGGATRRSQILLPEGLDSTDSQLLIAQKMAEESFERNTPAAAYLAATSIAPLTHWGTRTSGYRWNSLGNGTSESF